MKRQGLTLRILCGLVLCGVMAGCSDTSSPTGPSGGPSGPSAPQVVDRTFTLALNESASVHDGLLEATFRRVVSDNRCPGDAICIAAMAGAAVLEFDVISRDGTSPRQTTVQLSTLPSFSKTKVGVYTVALEQVMPYPFGSLPPIKAEDWRATLRITSLLD